MTGESGISLCDTCSNCECIFQTGVVREQCEFYIEKVEEIDFIAEHPKADMSKVNMIIVNGKEYVSIDRVLEIIAKYDLRDFKYHGDTAEYTNVNRTIRSDILALKGEQDGRT